MIYPWHLYAMAAMYILAGIMHFVKPKAYLRIMPKYLPNHKAMVVWSGLAEIVLGIGLCFPATKNIAIYAIILMLIVFFLVHFYMLSGKEGCCRNPKMDSPFAYSVAIWTYILVIFLFKTIKAIAPKGN